MASLCEGIFADEDGKCVIVVGDKKREAVRVLGFDVHADAIEEWDRRAESARGKLVLPHATGSVTPDGIAWSDGRTWRRLALSPRQLLVFQRPTPLLLSIFLCSVIVGALKCAAAAATAALAKLRKAARGSL